MGRLTKSEMRRHEQALKYLEVLPVTKNLDQREEMELFVLENYDHAYSSGPNVVNAGIFFTPIDLAKDFRIEAQGHNTIIDLCAGIGHLSYWLQDWVKWEELELVCVEIDPEFVEVGKVLVPNATWICYDILDPQFPDLFQKKKFSLAISNPPFGKNLYLKETPHLNYRGSSFEFKAIEVASKISRNGAFIIPQGSSPIIHYPEDGKSSVNISNDYIKFNSETGIYIEANCGIDANGHRWKGASPKVEIVTFDFTSLMPPVKKTKRRVTGTNTQQQSLF